MLTGTDSGFHFISDFKRCETYWRRRYYDQLELVQDDPHMLWGSFIHSGLAARSIAHCKQQSMDWQKLSAISIKAFEKSLEENRDRFRAYDYMQIKSDGIKLLTEYGIEYMHDKLVSISPKHVEVPLEWDFTSEADGFDFRHTGRIDNVARTSGQDYLVDHKSTGWNMGKLTLSLHVSQQSTAYIMLWNKNHPDRPIWKMIYNILRLYGSKPEFRRIVIERSEQDVADYIRGVKETVLRIQSKVASPEQFWDKDTGACFRYNRQCPYLELCQGANYESLIGIKYRRIEDEPDDERTHDGL